MHEMLSPEARYTNSLQRTVDALNTGGARFVVVGGIAVRAILGSKVEYKRPNGTVVDFDAIAFGSKEELASSFQVIQEIRSNDLFFPPVNIEAMAYAPEEHRSCQFLSGIRKDGQRYFLTYRAIEQEMPVDSFRTVERNYGGVIIPTLPAESIYYRYLIRGGVAKAKDLEKLVILRDFITFHPEEQISPESEQAYILFTQKIRQQYPCAIRLYQCYWNFDFLTGGRISGYLGTIPDILRSFR